ncbi:MAG: hypothetical protein N2235_21630, partial [Fischerella sp.]|nr:hypothetical protein [Fischerella sp.]
DVYKRQLHLQNIRIASCCHQYCFHNFFLCVLAFVNLPQRNRAIAFLALLISCMMQDVASAKTVVETPQGNFASLHWIHTLIQQRRFLRSH